MCHKGFLQFAELVNLLAVKFNNHVAFLQTSLGCSSVGRNFVNVNAGHRAVVNVLALFFLHVNLRAYVCGGDAQQGALNGAEVLKIFHYLIHNSSGNGKAVAGIRTGLRVYHGIDAHKFAVCVYQRAARVARVDGSVRLDKAFDAACCA